MRTSVAGKRLSILAAACAASIAWVPAAEVAAKPDQRGRDKMIPAESAQAGDHQAPAEAGKAVAVPDGPIPVAKCDEPVHDFGETWMGPTLLHSFVIKNDGQSPLQIVKVKPACGCTIAGQHPSTIAPGESGSFPFSVASTKLRGRFEKAITIQTNDPVNPDLRLKVAGVVKRYVDVLPTNAIFGKISGDEPQERVLKISNNTDNKLELKVEPAAVGPFKFALVETMPGKEFELKVNMTPPYTPGDYRHEVMLTSSVSEQATIPVTATAQIPQRLEIQPSTLTLNPATTADRPYVRPLRFTNYGTRPVKVTEAAATDPTLKVALNERTEGKAYTINVEIPAGYVQPSPGATLVLKTDDPDMPTINVPIVASPTAQAAQQRPQERPAQQLIGQPAPAFASATTDGKPVTNEAFKDSVAVLNFWAPNCGFCKKQIPTVEKVRQQYEGKGVRFIAVSQTMRKTFSDEEVKDVLKSTGYQGELAIDHGNSVGPVFKATSYPTMVVLGKTGRIEAVNIGAAPDLETKLKGQIDALLAGKPVPPDAPTPPTPTPPTPQPTPVESLVGKPAPAFSATTTEGKPFSNDTLKQAVTVADFWAANCGFCKKQLPVVEKVRQEYESKGVRFIAVQQTMRQPLPDAQIMEVLKSTGYAGEVLMDPNNTLGPKFGASGFPTMVVFGKDGKVGAINVGAMADLETRMKAQLDALLAGKPIPAEYAQAPARQQQQRPVEGLVGKKAPEFTFNTTAGKPLGSAEFGKNSATVLNFVAPNCGFCKKTAPIVEGVRQQYEAKGVRFVNVVQTMRQEYSTEDAAKIFKEAGSNLEMAHDPKNEIGGKFFASGFPTMVIVDKNGNVSAVHVGAKADLETAMKGNLDSLIAKGSASAKPQG